MDDTIVAALIGVIGGLIGAWIGGIISRKASREAVESSNQTAIDIMRRQEFNKAAAVFRATFVDEIFHVRRSAETLHKRWMERPEDIAIANEKAKIIFEVFLPDDMLIGFNAAWEQYKNPDKKSKITESPLNLKYYKKLRDIRLSHIYNLLEFAKPKI